MKRIISILILSVALFSCSEPEPKPIPISTQLINEKVGEFDYYVNRAKDKNKINAIQEAAIKYPDIFNAKADNVDVKSYVQSKKFDDACELQRGLIRLRIRTLLNEK